MRIASHRRVAGQRRAAAAALALLLACDCGETPPASPDGGDLQVCAGDAACGPGRICDGGLCRTGTRDTTAVVAKPDRLDFGLVQVGGRSSLPVNLSLKSGSPVRITALSIAREPPNAGAPEEFLPTMTAALPAALVAGTRGLDITVVYSPVDSGGDSAALVLTLDSGGQVRIPLSSRVEGAAVAALVENPVLARLRLRAGAEPEEVQSLELRSTGSEATSTFHVVNAGTGNAPLAVAAVRLEPPGTGITLAAVPRAPAADAPVYLPALREQATDAVTVRSLEVTVRYAAATACPKFATLVVTTDGAERTLPVAATGTATGADADRDGIPDQCDDCPQDPKNDSDGDHVCGGQDNCPSDANENQADADEDGIGDACDACAAGGPQDSDGDGACGAEDNCPGQANANQTDSDRDGVGDACDNCRSQPNEAQEDGDDDGAGDACDNCAGDSNPGQADSDNDGRGDACDACSNRGPDDADADGVCGAADNCPAKANPDQKNTDSDGHGDACDNCPAVGNADQADSDGDGMGDVCDACSRGGATDSDGDGVCGAQDNCPSAANADQADGDRDGVGDACDNCKAAANANQADGDGDLVGDACDNCRAAANGDQRDTDADRTGDACDACPYVAGTGDASGVCDVAIPATPDPGAYRYEPVQPWPGGEAQAVEFHPDGSYALILDYTNQVFVYDSATRALLPAYNLKPSGENIYWNDLQFDPAGRFAILVGTRYAGTTVRGGIVYRFDDAAFRARAPVSQVLTAWNTGANFNGEELEGVVFGYERDTAILLSANTGTTNHILKLWAFDPQSGTFKALFPGANGTQTILLARNSGSRCLDVQVVKSQWGTRGLLVVCDTTYQYWDGRMWSAPQYGAGATGNMSRAGSHANADYALVVGWSGRQVMRFAATANATDFDPSPTAPGTVNPPFQQPEWTTLPVWGIKFQQEGQRALIVGQYGKVLEYRHPLFTRPAFTEAHIPGNWDSIRFTDAAFRPGCDGGLVVGGRSTYPGSVLHVLRFDILNGRACP